jgi:hypothetical protein
MLYYIKYTLNTRERCPEIKVKLETRIEFQTRGIGSEGHNEEFNNLHCSKILLGR